MAQTGHRLGECELTLSTRHGRTTIPDCKSLSNRLEHERTNSTNKSKQLPLFPLPLPIPHSIMSLPSSTTQSVKHRQIAHLAQQLTLLSSRAETLEKLTVTTAEQASYMRLLGAYHASWYVKLSMGSGREKGLMLFVFISLFLSLPSSSRLDLYLTTLRMTGGIRFMAAGRVMTPGDAPPPREEAQ